MAPSGFTDTLAYTHTHTLKVSPCQWTTGPLCGAHMVGCRETSMLAGGMNHVSFLVVTMNVDTIHHVLNSTLIWKKLVH